MQQTFRFGGGSLSRDASPTDTPAYCANSAEEVCGGRDGGFRAHGMIGLCVGWK